jgi:predicted DNA-binding protein (UPF0251 family)
MDKTSNTIRPRPKRSEKITPDEAAALSQYVASLDTQYDAALDLGVSRVTLTNILLRKSGKPSTVAVIREKIKPFLNTDKTEQPCNQPSL